MLEACLLTTTNKNFHDYTVMLNIIQHSRDYSKLHTKELLPYINVSSVTF